MQWVPGYLIGEVQDDEGGVGHAGLLEVLAAGVAVVQLLRPVLVGAFGNLDSEKTDQKVTVRHARRCREPSEEPSLWASCSPHGLQEYLRKSPPASSRNTCYFICMYIFDKHTKIFFPVKNT